MFNLQVFYTSPLQVTKHCRQKSSGGASQDLLSMFELVFVDIISLLRGHKEHEELDPECRQEGGGADVVSMIT